jgi:hypothetical protein
MQGNPYFFFILVTNVAGKGDVAAMSARADFNTALLPMIHNWGQNWELDQHPELVGVPLSLLVSLENGQTINFWRVLPQGWQFGQSYQALWNFY